jgi:hypothetical protein
MKSFEEMVEHCLSIFHGQSAYGWHIIKQQWPHASVAAQRTKMGAVLKSVQTFNDEGLDNAIAALKVAVLTINTLAADTKLKADSLPTKEPPSMSQTQSQQIEALTATLTSVVTTLTTAINTLFAAAQANGTGAPTAADMAALASAVQGVQGIATTATTDASQLAGGGTPTSTTTSSASPSTTNVPSDSEDDSSNN